MTPEYEYSKAEKDADINLRNLAYVYMGYDAFPFRDYVNHNINTGKISVKTIMENEEVREYAEKKLEALGLSIDRLTDEMLAGIVEKLSDEKLRKLVPYTTMLIRVTEDAKKQAEKELKGTNSNAGPVLFYEEKIADAIDHNYAVMVDSRSIVGIQRIVDELKQHDTFSYAFALIFLIVALLVISTTMSRLVERQRTVIGTMNALGMKTWKIALHYVEYSFFVALVGAVLGVIVGPLVVGQLIVDMLMEWYMVPGVSVGSNAMFVVVTAAVIACCVFASYFSCRKLLRVPPAATLRPAAPQKAKRLLAERLPFWGRLGFNTQPTSLLKLPCV